METKTLFDEMKGVWQHMQTSMAEQGRESGEQKQMLERFNARLDTLETRLNRPSVADAAVPDTKKARSAERKAFDMALRYGVASVQRTDADLAKAIRIAGPGETKALSLGDDTAGGFDRILSAA